MLMPYEYGVDLPGELLRISNAPFALQIASGTLQEIRALAGKTGRRSAAARFVLGNLGKIKQRFGVEEIQSSGPVDDWIIKYSSENKETCVATNDIPLRKRLLALGVPVIAMKGKSKLDFV